MQDVSWHSDDACKLFTAEFAWMQRNTTYRKYFKVVLSAVELPFVI